MSGLEIFAIGMLAVMFYCISTLLIGAIATDCDPDMMMFMAWILGIALFTIVVLAWASGKPFPIGGGA